MADIDAADRTLGARDRVTGVTSEGGLTREVVFASRPKRNARLDTFALRDVRLPALAPGEVLVRNLWMSVDSYFHVRMREGPPVIRPLELGQAPDGDAVGVVEASRDGRLEVGDVVLSKRGWREAFHARADELEVLDTVAFPAPAYLGPVGKSGLLGYVAMTEILDVRAGETVFVPAASGAAGLVACQVARIRGATVVGSARGAGKCEFLRRIGVDHVIDFEATDDFAARLREAAPHGIAACLDGIGGPQFSAALEVAAPRARFAVTGISSDYNTPYADPEVHRMDIFNIISKQLSVRGFMVREYLDRRPRFLSQMKSWMADGRIVWRQTVYNGLERAPEAFLHLFDGGSYGGKVLVQL